MTKYFYMTAKKLSSTMTNLFFVCFLTEGINEYELCYIFMIFLKIIMINKPIAR